MAENAERVDENLGILRYSEINLQAYTPGRRFRLLGRKNDRFDSGGALEYAVAKERDRTLLHALGYQDINIPVEIDRPVRIESLKNV